MSGTCVSSCISLEAHAKLKLSKYVRFSCLFVSVFLGMLTVFAYCLSYFPGVSFFVFFFFGFLVLTLSALQSVHLCFSFVNFIATAFNNVAEQYTVYFSIRMIAANEFLLIFFSKYSLSALSIMLQYNFFLQLLGCRRRHVPL